jgi:hemolysin activation/secretion protein
MFISKNSKFNLLFFLVFLLLNIKSIAAQSNQNAGSILRQELDIEKKRNIPTEIPKAPIIKEKNTTLSKENAKILVKEFQFTGEIKLISKSELSNHLKDLIGKSLSVDEIRGIQDRLVKFYESKGFKFTKVTIPKQEVQNGIITITIQEGQINSKNLENFIIYV